MIQKSDDLFHQVCPEAFIGQIEVEAAEVWTENSVSLGKGEGI